MNARERLAARLKDFKGIDGTGPDTATAAGNDPAPSPSPSPGKTRRRPRVPDQHEVNRLQALVKAWRKRPLGRAGPRRPTWELVREIRELRAAALERLKPQRQASVHRANAGRQILKQRIRDLEAEVAALKGGSA